MAKETKYTIIVASDGWEMVIFVNGLEIVVERDELFVTAVRSSE